MYDFLLCGYYGYHNMGDDSMLFAIVNRLKQEKPGVSLCALTHQGTLPDGISPIDTVDRFSLLRVISAMKNSRVVVFGGGNLLQDATSSRSLSYYLFLLRLARSMKKKIMLYANGIGPLSPKSIQPVAKVLRKVDVLSLREPQSFALCEKMGLAPSKLFLTADEVLAAPCTPGENLPYAVVSLRGWHELDDRFAVEFSGFLQSLSLKPVFACLQDSADLPLTESVVKLIPGAEIRARLSRDEFADLVKNSSLVIGMRLHALVYGVAYEKPCLGISYDKKIDGFLSYCNNKHLVSCRKISSESLKQHADELLCEDEKARHELRIRLQEAARQNAALALQLLEETK